MTHTANTNISIEVQELIRQAEAIVGTGQFKEAINKLDEAEKIDKKITRIYLDRAAIYILISDLDMASKEIEKAKIIDDTDGAIYFHEGNIAYINKDIDKAKACYSKAIEMGFETNNIYFHMANCLAEQNETDAALYYYGKAETLAPYEGRTTIKKIQLLIKNNDYQKALLNAKKLIEIKPEAFEGYHFKILSLLALERCDEAKQELDRAVSMFPDDLGFKYDYIIYCEHTKKYDEAVEIIDTYFLSDNDNGRWDYLIAEKAKLLFKAEKYDEAEEIALSVLKLKHDDEMAYYVMFKRLTHADYDRAIYYALEIIRNRENAKNQDAYYAAVYYEALAYMKKGDSEKAEALFRNAIIEFRSECVKHPGNINLYVYRTLAYKAVGELQKALESANYIITLTNGQFVEGYYLRAMIYDDLNEKDKAEQDRKIVEASGSPVINILS